jgi:regulator of sirC expression with transglutaminase-like and TPR domain
MYIRRLRLLVGNHPQKPLQPIHMSLTDTLFALERLQFQGKSWQRASVYLSELVGAVDHKRLNSQLPEEQAAQLWGVLFEKESFRAYRDCESTHFTLCDTLNRRGGSCLGIATVFMVLAEAWDMPFRPLLTEGHISLVHPEADPPLILEPLPSQYGKLPLDHRTITQLEKILTNEEFLAVHLSNRATFVYARAGLMDDAVFLIDSALELFPDYTAGWINRAAMMKKLDNPGEMRRSLDMAKSLNPGIRYTKAIEQIEGEIQ